MGSGVMARRRMGSPVGRGCPGLGALGTSDLPALRSLGSMWKPRASQGDHTEVVR